VARAADPGAQVVPYRTARGHRRIAKLRARSRRPTSQ
jgi:hypothetical protein